MKFLKRAKETSVNRTKDDLKLVEKLSVINHPTTEEDKVLDYCLRHYHQGLLYYKQGEWSNAEKQWLKILKKMPNHVGDCLDILYRKQRRYKNEIDMLKAAIIYTKQTPVKEYQDSRSVEYRLEKAKQFYKKHNNEDESLDITF